jgi:hypothetical protein
MIRGQNSAKGGGFVEKPELLGGRSACVGAQGCARLQLFFFSFSSFCNPTVN